MNSIDRRSFLGSVASCSVVPLGAFLPFRPDYVVQDLRTIDVETNEYRGWPTLAIRKNGELVLVYSGGRQAHICPFGRVEFKRSLDRGKHWSRAQVLLDSPIDDRDAGILETSQGTLLVTTFTSLAYEDSLKRALDGNDWPSEKIDQWTAQHEKVSAEERSKHLGVWVLRSEDGGRSWSEPKHSIVNSPHGPIELADGRLLYAGVQLWADDRRVGVCESVNDGNSWRWIAEIPTRPGDRAANYHELHAVEATPGHIVVHIRNHNPNHDREILQTESRDGGRTWSIPRPIGVWGLPSHLLRLKNGHLMMTYGHRRKPFGIQARVSTDGGVGWSEPINLYDHGVSTDLGYPSTVQFDDGKFLTVWYEKRPEKSNALLRQLTWWFI